MAKVLVKCVSCGKLKGDTFLGVCGECCSLIINKHVEEVSHNLATEWDRRTSEREAELAERESNLEVNEKGSELVRLIKEIAKEY